MKIQAREQQAYEVYINFLENKVFRDETIAIRTYFLDKLMPLLADKVQSGSVFREMVDQLLQSTPEGDWPESLQIAREYYPFWSNDIKAIALLKQSDEVDALPIEWKPEQVDLAKLWREIDEEKFSRIDSWALKAYAKALQKHTEKQKLIDTRIKLAKLLLTRLGGAPAIDNKAYRVVADATHPLFTNKMNRALFLTVVREFFHFWAGNPNADAYIKGNKAVKKGSQ